MFEKFSFKLSALIAIYSAPTLTSVVKGGWKTSWNWKFVSQMHFWFSLEERVILLLLFFLFPFTDLANSSTAFCTLFSSTIKFKLHIAHMHLQWLFFLPYTHYIYLTKKINEDLYKCRILTTTLKGILLYLSTVLNISRHWNQIVVLQWGTDLLAEVLHIKRQITVTRSVTEHNPTNIQIIKD